ncbi:AraC family transcriptional regulator [Mycobacterium hackensackense]|uniref:helix-turn-helix domain-containing protein n=1 Tax=Mycobacterium hackensackense TaxID=228909 RepID=UPI002265814A|nr:AraC family transcriptional regulator [Mycobacterium hackensackense]MCV7253559.1 AraC family transcriptional regulator [Mycobacterium hackensackense]
MAVSEREAASALVSELSRLARHEGANAGAWPGLTTYRFTRPTRLGFDDIDRLALAVIVPATQATDEMCYRVLGDRRDTGCGVVAASVPRPAWCLVLQIEPQLVRAVGENVRGRAQAKDLDPRGVSPLDTEMSYTVARFLGALTSADDRRVLAPLYLQELVYRVLQREQRVTLVELAAAQTIRSPIGSALSYISANLAEPLRVDTLAAQACLSPSAFSRAFRDLTAQSPYQYVKEKRLDHARRLLDGGQVGVTAVSREVGYTSVSHFIKEFHGRYGVTPGRYAGARPDSWGAAAG